MKQGKLVKTRNVVETDEAINLLVTRPKGEMVGLGLLYGKPGLGKTTYASRMALLRNYVYLRLEATTTPKAFSLQLIDGLYNYLNLQYPPRNGATNAIFRRCMNIIEEHEDIVIIIDEIDYAFRQPQLLGAIRDIVDETLAIVILVGMQNARDRLAQINEYYFDRCNSFYEFEAASLKDISMIAKEIMEVSVSQEQINTIYFNSGGNLRKAMKMLHLLEANLKANPEYSLNNPETRKAPCSVSALSPI
jgi:replication-associated recombination protein RarA